VLLLHAKTGGESEREASWAFIGGGERRREQARRRGRRRGWGTPAAPSCRSTSSASPSAARSVRPLPPRFFQTRAVRSPRRDLAAWIGKPLPGSFCFLGGNLFDFAASLLLPSCSADCCCCCCYLGPISASTRTTVAWSPNQRRAFCSDWRL
jgi:hypothetical protein